MDMTITPSELHGIVHAPASKSEAHRRMICAGLAYGKTSLRGFMESEDMVATRACLKALGASFSLEGDTLAVEGIADTKRICPVMDCGESGSTLRFFVPIAMAKCGGGIFRMHGRLGQRPMDVYRDLFVPQGTGWRMGIGADGAAELHVTGHLQAGAYVLPGNVSSQFVSGLLFALPLLDGESTLTVQPPVESVGYIHMTLRALKDSGIRFTETAPYTWTIPGKQQYRAEDGTLTGDYSQAAVLLCAAALGQDVAVDGLSADSIQGDRSVLNHLRALGAEIEEKDGCVRVVKPAQHGAVLEMNNCPDIAPMLALTCQLVPGESRLKGCGRLRLKECDRLQATAEILRQLGGNARVEGDALVLTGMDQLTGGVTVDTRNDHRMVMLTVIAALQCQKPVTVSGVESLSKSWPNFLNEIQALGGKMA